ncbi:TetR/AcrR family transcriptional regulator [Roseibium sp. MMSF_3544]|uniref:TetR/AcrR family transcriptional regulator n=1 Tax=unclassified Roseibium TaxID=2629323 RepID=UPI00273E8B00|nr:TetR/AcrR family transcriptional regulator [Roseibium sp. MMSF_3544]
MKLTEKKRQSIIEAAIADFRDHGFAGANMTRIAKMAKVSIRTLYNHFESKDVLFDAITAMLIEAKEALEPFPFDPNKSLEEQLNSGLHEYMSALSDPLIITLNRIMIPEYMRDLEKSRDYYRELGDNDYAMTHFVAEAMKAGLLKEADPVLATENLLGLARNYFFWPLVLTGEQPDRNDIANNCVEMFLARYDNRSNAKTLGKRTV